MPKVKLWNVEVGKLVSYDVMADQNGDILCEYDKGDVNDIIKFPGGLSKKEFLALVDKHNEANEGVHALDVAAIEERDAANQELLDSL